MSIQTLLVRGFVLFPMAAGLLAANDLRSPGDWKTWVIASGSEHGTPPPPNAKDTLRELVWLRSVTSNPDPQILEQIRYWDAGPPSYRWMEMVAKRQTEGQTLGQYFVRAHSYVALAMYDATVATYNAKTQYKRRRPSEIDRLLTTRVDVPDSPSYPSEYAATAAAAAAVLSYLVPAEEAYFQEMAKQAAQSRVYAGSEYPSDYEAGWALGLRVAQQVIAKAQADGSSVPFSGPIPTGPCKWTGTNPGNASAANWRPLLMNAPSEFRPAPPPDCDSAEVQADLAAVKNYPRALTGPNFATNAKAFYWQTNEGVFPWALVHLNRWVLEDRMETAAAARAYALLGATGFDAFIASQDGKFAYWYIRPAQLDPTLTPLFPAPNFPSYPSNHSTFSTARSEILAYLFPNRADYIRALGKEAGDSRIWAGIHYEMDNRAGAMLGRKVAERVMEWAENDDSR